MYLMYKFVKESAVSLKHPMVKIKRRNDSYVICFQVNYGHI